MALNNYRPATLRKVGVTPPDLVCGDMRAGIEFNLPWHHGASACKLTILDDDDTMPYVTYSGPYNHRPGIILLHLPHWLQQAIHADGVALGIEDMQVLHNRLHWIRWRLA